MFPVIWKLMCAYLVIAFMGFCLIFFCLDRIGARIDPEKTGRQVNESSQVFMTYISLDEIVTISLIV